MVSESGGRSLSPDGFHSNRRYSIFNEFSSQVKGEATENPRFQQSVKDLKEKAEELNGVKEYLKVVWGGHFNESHEMVERGMQKKADDRAANKQGDAETLKKFCSTEVIGRCKAFRLAYQSQVQREKYAGGSHGWMQRKVQIHRKNLNLFALFIIPCHCSTLICTHFLFFFHQKLFMSCLPIRLPPPKKAWKSFTSKLRTKLHRIHTANSIRKRRFQLNPSPPWLAFRPPKPLWLRLRLGQKRQPFKPSSTRFLCRKRQLILNRKRGPVYVDNLFNEKMDLEKLEGVEVKLGLKKTEEENGEEDHGGGNGADEMWESLALASPLMHGIDDRAEHFIARFRADMEVQHILPPSS